MVDRKARREYAQLVRQFISGRMTNREYEERYEALQHDASDRVIHEINAELWYLYDDILTHRMLGRYRLEREGHRIIAQAVLFLQSDQEYGWPVRLWGGSVFLLTAFCVLLIFALNPEVSLMVRSALSVPAVVLWRCYERRQAKRFARAGDTDAWPFLHQADLEAAKKLPRLLNGQRQAEA